MGISQKLPEELAFLANARLPQKTTQASMLGQTCVITGATSGVGYQAAKRLAQAGANLILIVRNEAHVQKLKLELEKEFKVTVDYYVADFTVLEQVRFATQRLLEKHDKIDVLINNAGVHMTTRQLTPDGHETAFCVNHLASFLITCLMIPRMKKHAPTRIIQVNSEGHRFNGLDLNDLTWAKRNYKGIRGYGASKTAQLMTVWELQDELAASGVTINAMHPGAVKSNIGLNNGWLYRAYSKYFVSLFLKKPEIAGDALYYLAAAPEMATVSGNFYHLTNHEIPARHARNREIGKEIFKLSKEIVDLEH